MYRVLTDEVQDITVAEQLCYICEVCERKRRGQDCIPWNKGPNAEDITKKLLELLANCNLPNNCMSRFVSDGAKVMTEKRSGAAARRKKLQPAVNSF